MQCYADASNLGMVAFFRLKAQPNDHIEEDAEGEEGIVVADGFVIDPAAPSSTLHRARRKAMAMEVDRKEAEEWLEGEAGKCQKEQTASKLRELKSLHSQRLWHNLSELLEREASTGALADEDTLLAQMYPNVIQRIEDRISPLRAARIASIASGKTSSLQEALDLLDGVYERLSLSTTRKASHPLLYLRASRALALLRRGDAPAAKERIDSCLSELETLVEPDPSVPAAVHYAASQLHKARQEFADFYKHGLKYLAYTEVEHLPQEHRMVSHVYMKTLLPFACHLPPHVLRSISWIP